MLKVQIFKHVYLKLQIKNTKSHNIGIVNNAKDFLLKKKKILLGLVWGGTAPSKNFILPYLKKN